MLRRVAAVLAIWLVGAPAWGAPDATSPVEQRVKAKHLTKWLVGDWVIGLSPDLARQITILRLAIATNPSKQAIAALNLTPKERAGFDRVRALAALDPEASAAQHAEMKAAIDAALAMTVTITSTTFTLTKPGGETLSTTYQVTGKRDNHLDLQIDASDDARAPSGNVTVIFVDKNTLLFQDSSEGNKDVLRLTRKAG